MKTTFTEYIQYKLQNILAKGTGALLSLLGLISIIFILITGLLVKFTPEGMNDSFIHIIWSSLMRTLDPGTMGADEGSWPFLFSMLFITMVGIFIISILIGIITTGIQNWIISLQKGRSKVIENGHTLILGWNGRIMSIISELIITNNQYNRKFYVVILAEKDKVEMEDTIRDKIGKTGNTRIICRSGDSTEKNDIQLVNIEGARSVILLPPDSSYADIETFKTIMMIQNRYDKTDKKLHIVTEVRYEENIDLIKMVGEGQVEVISPKLIVAKIIAQTARQPGLSVLYNELLSFNGDEIYFYEENNLVGKKYKDVLLSYKTCSVIGIFNLENKSILNPQMDYEIQPEDKIICIAEDKEKIKIDKNIIEIIKSELIVSKKSKAKKDNILIINWNRITQVIVREIDSYAVPGSTITIVANNFEIDDTTKGKTSINYENCIVYSKKGDTTSLDMLSSLKLDKYDNIIVVGDSDNLTNFEADSRTLITLLLLRKLCESLSKKPIIVSQILNERHRNIAEETKADDFIVSEKLVGQYLAQVSENRHLHDLFLELFSAEGAEIYFKPVSDYIELGTTINFATLVKSGINKNESVIGYRIVRDFDRPDLNYGVSLNPDKDKKVKFSSDDKLIVLASISYEEIDERI